MLIQYHFVQVGKRMPKKYSIEGDLREALYK